MQLALSLDFFQRVGGGGHGVVTVGSAVIRGGVIIAATGSQGQYHH